jgi:hypothetical protein
MITGLLFTLAQKPAKPANENGAEGRHFPPPSTKKSKRTYDVIRLTQKVSLALALAGTAMLIAGVANWSFNPATGLHVRVAALNFTLPVGVSL